MTELGMKSKSVKGTVNGSENAMNGEVKAKKKQKNQKSKPQVEPLVKHKEEKKWFEYQVDGIVEDASVDKVSDEETKELFGQADVLLRTDFDLHSRMLRSKGGSEASWLLSVVKKGTASDRMTAMQLQMHQSPVHSLPYAESMIATIEKKNTREAMDLIPILEEIFLNHFLPINRKLISFSSRPLARINEICSNREQGRNRILVLWMFEHKLKMAYERFLKALEIVAAGVVEDLSKRALRTALNLLAERPEGEQQLLTMLVNKLGHPSYRIGAHVATLLEELTRRQPNMRPVIVKETERLVYRKNVSERAHLYAATFLSQICLRAGEDSLAVQMLSIYFGLFKTLIARRKPDNRLLTILLSAANRAFPYAKEKAESLTEDINALYKVVHTGSFTVALQTMKLLYQVLHLSDNLSDRFYSALYRKLFDPIPPACYNQLMLLLFRCMKTDVAETRVRTFVKRLLQVATGSPPPLAAGILILVSKLAEQRPSLLVLKKDVDKVAKAAVLLGDDDDDEHFVDVGLDGKPLIKGEAAKKEEAQDSDSDDDEVEVREEKKNIKGQVKSTGVGGWVHKATRVSRSAYDHSARNPLFIDCKQMVDSELLLLARHYHPSVAIFAQQLLEGKYVNYKGDPLQDYTMMKFLDRFAYKNPKDGSAPKSAVRVAHKKAYDPWGVKKLALSSKEYLSKKSSELPPDERYLHRFAQLKFQAKEAKKSEEDEWDIESVGSEEFDRIIEQFEPGEANEEFTDFGQEFSAEKQRKRVGTKRQAESDGEDDELDEDEYGEDGEEDEEDEDLDMEGDEDEEEEDDEDIEMESDGSDSEGERAFARRDTTRRDSGSESDELEGDVDAEMAADRFGVMLEEYEDEETQNKKKMKHKTRKPKGFKKRKY